MLNIEPNEAGKKDKELKTPEVINKIDVMNTNELKNKIAAETASEEIREKLRAMTNEQWEALLKQLKQFVKGRLHGRTAYGAHTIEFIGEDPHEHYVYTAIAKILTFERKWDFTVHSLTEQLKRIIGSMISTNVEKYKNHDIHFLNKDENTIEYLAQVYSFEKEDNEFDRDKELQYELLDKAYHKIFNELEKKVYDMVYNERLGTREIAEILDMDFQELQALKHNARRRLIRYIKNNFEEYKKLQNSKL